MNNQVLMTGKIKDIVSSKKREDNFYETIFNLEVENEYKNQDGTKGTNIVKCNYREKSKSTLKKDDVVGIKGNLVTSKKQISSVNVDDLEVNIKELSELDKNSNKIFSLNYVVVVGRIVFNPELKVTSTGKKVTNVTIVVPSEDKQKDSLFIRNTLWGRTAENVAKYCKKGDVIGIKGSLKTVEKTIDNNKDSILELVGEKVYFYTKSNTTNLDNSKSNEKEV